MGKIKAAHSNVQKPKPTWMTMIEKRQNNNSNTVATNANGLASKQANEQASAGQQQNANYVGISGQRANAINDTHDGSWNANSNSIYNWKYVDHR